MHADWQRNSRLQENKSLKSIPITTASKNHTDYPEKNQTHFITGSTTDKTTFTMRSDKKTCSIQSRARHPIS
jgi:hypothetical protein